MHDLRQLARELCVAYRDHHENNPRLLEAIGAVGVVAFSALYLVRLTGELPARWDDFNFRLLAIFLCALLALRQQWPRVAARFYLPYSYGAIFYCLAFFLPLTLLQNGGATNTIVNMVIGAVLIILLTDWRNTMVVLFTGYVMSAAFYWILNPYPRLPTQFLYWWMPLCAVLVTGGSISKYVEKRAELRRLRRVYAGVAGSIAHEMRTPLAQIQQALDTIAALVPPGSEAAVAVGHGRRSVRRGLQAITLTLQQLNTEAPDTTRLEVLSAAHCVRKALAEYAYEDNRQRDKVSVQVDQDFIFRGDETAFRHVMFNLLKNALYYLPLKAEAQVFVNVTRTPAPSVIVRDTGPGLAPELRARLFEEFQTAGKAAGTGLGLAFCRRAMQTLGGDIQCSSRVGEYTQFTLTFPRVLADRTIASQTRAAPRDVVDLATEVLAGHRVLVVDDNSLNRAVARARLAALGAQVTEAAHAAEALRSLSEGAHADAILMDMNMPGMSGVEATRALRALPGAIARTPVLLITADPTDRARRDAFEAGIDAFLLKPLEPELLHYELVRLLAPHKKSRLAALQ